MDLLIALVMGLFVAAKRALIGKNNTKAEKPKILMNFLFFDCIKLV